jgi:phage protein D
MTKSPNDSLQLGISFEIKVGGKSLPKNTVVMKIRVNAEVNKIATATVAILGGNSYESLFKESEIAEFEPGKDIEISIGYAEKNTKVFSGVIQKHRLAIDEGYLNYSSRSKLILEATDKAFKMKIGRKSDLYEKKKDSDIINSLIAGAGLSKKVENTSFIHDSVSRHHVSDWEFLLNRAKANGMLVLNSLNKITVETPKVSGSSKVRLIYGKDAYSFHADLDAGDQLQQIESAAYDVFNEKEVKQNGAEPAQLDKPGSIAGKNLGKVFSPQKLNWNTLVPLESKELKFLADSAMIFSRLKRIKGDISFKGVVDINLGDIVELEGFGKLFNGLVYVTALEHRVENGDFITALKFGLKDDWFKKESFLDLNVLPPISGLHVGIVKKIDGDPDKKGRIQVMIPAIKNSGNGIWAVLSHFHANNQSGSFFIPEVNAEVIVGFLNDDPRFPIILGSLYSKNNKPKDSIEKENKTKSIVTKSGLRLEFNDKDKFFKVTTPGKNTLLISDKDKGVKIEDQNGNEIITSSKSISLKSKKDILLTASGKLELKGAKGVLMSSSSGDVSISGKKVGLKAKAKFEASGSAGADIKSSGVVNIKGSMVNVN